MNKYARGFVAVPFGAIKMMWTKLYHINSFSGPIICQISPFPEITIDRGNLSIGKRFKMRDGAKIRVRKGAVCEIGDNSSVSSNNIIACREKIKIGNNVQLSPNVQIYDHDHDFRVKSGISEGMYKTAPVEIGNNVWIGANTIILRGTKIGDNCVIGAGSIVKGNVLSNSVFLQKKENMVKEIERIG